MPTIKPQKVEGRDGLVVLTFEDAAGQIYMVTLNSLDATHYAGMMRTAIEEATAHPLADSYGMPGMTRVQYVETQETELLRILLNDQVWHEYVVPKGTTLGEDLKAFGDRVEARNLAKATHRPPEGQS